MNVLLVLPVTLFIPALALAQVTSINLHVINAVCVCVCVIYTMLVSLFFLRSFDSSCKSPFLLLLQGGIKAVVWTDVVQAAIMLGSTVLSVYMGVRDVGGLSNVFSIAEKGGRMDFVE